MNRSSGQAEAKNKAKTAGKHETREQKRLRKHGPKANVSFRRNFLPVIAGVTVMLLFLAGLNSQWIYSQFQYRQLAQGAVQARTAASTTPADTSTSANKDPNPELGARMEIPTLGVKAPVQLDQGTAEWEIQLGLRAGVVHYDGSVVPGQAGNSVIFGHSSGAVWAPGDYKFVFTMLDKIKPGDPIYVYYGGLRYTYAVAGSRVVPPTDVSVLNSDGTNKLTLITCTPVGTSTDRLVVSASQVAPAPVAGPASATELNGIKALPGSAN